MPNLTPTTAVQDYLKAIHQLGGSRRGVSTSALADRLQVSPASVSGMLKRLHEQGLVSHKRYQGVKLTRKGSREAIEMIRHHRLLELYLANVVGMPWDKVHAEADALEHVISEDLESRLDELLGFPTTDPHGHPIPSASLELDEGDHPSLGDVEPGEYVVRSVEDRDSDLLRHLDGLGLRPGARVLVEERIPYRGGVRICVGSTEYVVGSDAASAVEVAAA
jgi:DtxR family transcriptional regulator, Mn-dependent transcriptional regulator